METLSPSDTLVIILSETRAHELTYQLFEKNVLKHLNADLALCVRNNEKRENNPFYQNAKYIWDYEEESSDLSKYYDMISKQENSTEDWKKILLLDTMLAGGLPGHMGSGAYNYLYKWYLVQNIRNLGLVRKYKWFVLARSDNMWNVPHLSMSDLDEDKIYIPNGEHHSGYCDRHLIVSYKYFEQCINLMKLIIHFPDSVVQNNPINPESLFKLCIEKNGLKNNIVFFPYMMYTVRAIDGATRWSIGEYYPELGYCIKYAAEYDLYKVYIQNNYPNLINTTVPKNPSSTLLNVKNCKIVFN